MAVDFSKSKTRENLMPGHLQERVRQGIVIQLRQSRRVVIICIPLARFFYSLQIRSGHTRKCFMNC